MKDFKFAQIVPRSCLHMIENNHYHMCLAHLVHKELQDDKVGGGGSGDHRYTDFYSRMSSEGKFVLMDNGAAEGSQLCVADLLKAYELVNPTEVVVPDTLLDSKDTLWKMEKFVRNLGDKLPYRFMGVPQGNDMAEWIHCATKMLENERINTIGISKFLNIATGDPAVRFGAALAIQSLAMEMGRTDIEIHLLGCDEGPAIVHAIKTLVPMVRGCDSAFAYIAALSGKKINDATKRPEGEIDFLNGECPKGLVYRLEEMEQATGVVDNTSPDLWRDE